MFLMIHHIFQYFTNIIFLKPFTIQTCFRIRLQIFKYFLIGLHNSRLKVYANRNCPDDFPNDASKKKKSLIFPLIRELRLRENHHFLKIYQKLQIKREFTYFHNKERHEEQFCKTSNIQSLEELSRPVANPFRTSV